MRQSFKDMATRSDTAERNFIETLRRQGGISEADARKVMTLYLKEKIAKLDWAIGRINVKHGAFLEKDVIQRAARA